MATINFVERGMGEDGRTGRERRRKGNNTDYHVRLGKYLSIMTGTQDLLKQVDQQPTQFLRDLYCQRSHDPGPRNIFDI